MGPPSAGPSVSASYLNSKLLSQANIKAIKGAKKPPKIKEITKRL